MPASLTQQGRDHSDHIMVGQQNGMVLLHFERPVTWTAVNRQHALQLAYQLVAAARAAGASAPTQRHLF